MGFGGMRGNFKKSTTHGGLHLIADRVLYVLERGLNNLKYYLFRK